MEKLGKIIGENRNQIVGTLLLSLATTLTMELGRWAIVILQIGDIFEIRHTTHPTLKILSMNIVLGILSTALARMSIKYRKGQFVPQLLQYTFKITRGIAIFTVVATVLTLLVVNIFQDNMRSIIFF